jgi:hypothetical protein
MKKSQQMAVGGWWLVRKQHWRKPRPPIHLLLVNRQPPTANR